MPSIRFNKVDNVFIIKSGLIEYIDTLENMHSDSGVIFPAMPENQKHYYFNNTKKFAKYSDGESESEAPLFDECITLLINLDNIIHNKSLRENPPLTLAERITQKQSATKSEAQEYIYLRYPKEQQNNMLARGLEIQRNFRINNMLTAEETATEAAILSAWEWVKEVRAEENRLFDEIALSIEPETINANWPA